MNLRTLAGKALRSLRGPKYKTPARDADKYRIQGSWMYVDDRDSMQLTKYGIYGPEQTSFIKSLVKSDYVCLDIGANIGYFTLIMAKQAKLVHAFEPEPRNFDILQKNIVLNNIQNVTLYNSAVSSEASDRATLHLCSMNRGMHRLYQSHWCKEGTVQVQTLRIDDHIQQADFIKMDIEGAELGALRGMKKMLESGTTLLMEFHPPSIVEYGADPGDVYDFMKSLDYSVEIPGRNEDVSLQELERIANEKAGTNILCRRHSS
ncbi:MAG TPA: FkbM family methyltransferase [Nitrososphaera sp.]|nr:FkbM family methyltransferase [Nitrososphaera sp.]